MGPGFFLMQLTSLQEKLLILTDKGEGQSERSHVVKRHGEGMQKRSKVASEGRHVPHGWEQVAQHVAGGQQITSLYNTKGRIQSTVLGALKEQFLKQDTPDNGDSGGVI